MRWAIVSSLIVHSIFIGFIFRNSSGKMTEYPPVMMVRLASPPPLRGVRKSEAAKISSQKSKKKVQKTEVQKADTRLAEVNKRKRPKRKKTEPEPSPKAEPSTQEATEPERKGLPEGVELGSEFGSARLDAAGFDSPYYLNVLFSKIRNHWDNPFEGVDTVSCVIYFVIGRKGKIIDSAVETTSGIPAYDQAALRAVLAAKPPPLPNQFGSDELGIHLEFKYIPYF